MGIYIYIRETYTVAVQALMVNVNLFWDAELIKIISWFVIRTMSLILVYSSPKFKSAINVPNLIFVIWEIGSFTIGVCVVP